MDTKQLDPRFAAAGVDITQHKMSVNAAAQKHGISEPTLRRYARKMGWVVAAAEASKVRSKLVREQLQPVLKGANGGGLPSRVTKPSVSAKHDEAGSGALVTDAANHAAAQDAASHNSLPQPGADEARDEVDELGDEDRDEAVLVADELVTNEEAGDEAGDEGAVNMELVKAQAAAASRDLEASLKATRAIQSRVVKMAKAATSSKELKELAQATQVCTATIIAIADIGRPAGPSAGGTQVTINLDADFVARREAYRQRLLDKSSAQVIDAIEAHHA